MHSLRGAASIACWPYVGHLSTVHWPLSLPAELSVYAHLLIHVFSLFLIYFQSLSALLYCVVSKHPLKVLVRSQQSRKDTTLTVSQIAQTIRKMALGFVFGKILYSILLERCIDKLRCMHAICSSISRPTALRTFARWYWMKLFTYHV